MNNKEIERISSLPKQYVDNVLILANEEYFAMILSSGTLEQAYALTPKHLKRLAQTLTHNVESYEKTFGLIETKWEPGIQSPIPMSALNQKNNSDKTGDNQ